MDVMNIYFGSNYSHCPERKERFRVVRRSNHNLGRARVWRFPEGYLPLRIRFVSICRKMRS
jgi:hypothetical protein